MSRLEKYHGIIPAFYACYDENGAVSPERVRKLAQYFVDRGVQGLYVNGSSGECIYLSVEERKTILENVMAVVAGKLTVICHVACNNTEDSKTLASHAGSLGVDAIASIPPIYFHLPDYAIAAYWNAISDAAPETDFVIYNIPQLAGVSLSVPLFLEMRKNPRVIGVKNSSMPVQDILQFKDAGGKDCVIFNGPDEQYLAGRVIGADGGIGGTYGVMCEVYLTIERLIRANRMEEAKKIQYLTNTIITKLCSGTGSMYSIIKEVLRINDGIDIGSVRAPFMPLSEGDDLIAKEAARMIREAREVCANL